MAIWQVVLLGLIEGLTEFIPVSSTGHILLVGHFLGFKSPGKTFEVLIQLGAILAVCVLYAAKLWRVLVTLPSDPASRLFAAGDIVRGASLVVWAIAEGRRIAEQVDQALRHGQHAAAQ